MRKPESYTSVWDAIADTPAQAANLRARAELMRQIAALLKRRNWTQAEAARHCGVTQPRINDLLRGRISRFSLDALVNISTALGCRVRIGLQAASRKLPAGPVESKAQPVHMRPPGRAESRRLAGRRSTV